jgi:uncharacterized protein YodC (DUF2158 family)
MKQAKFSANNEVVLITGSLQRMVIDTVNMKDGQFDGTYKCRWITKRGVPKHCNYSEDTLKLAPKEFIGDKGIIR